ncbi:hypothetical protein VOLCADRAFT_95402 [Volvox carteri f. nagariensis]|uniref:Uncharacterized protein n=1 Tax=Volvox carteri f. nagariensis TaxID=3068 RepID=D8U7C4_VOLCA|nr:uncharacterized protein VOLCADRAFT_95402 [Volvox carteri f. nagariensis]EFJ44396.1 hypothetical protein VOLCADRAFT_95402 [Volvox carteri f. nagariensis]|eukprot:XP_002954503.1 hypothetical protein VOLCADRAFT_95402 [Volvox carteri f. nagariensis]
MSGGFRQVVGGGRGDEGEREDGSRPGSGAGGDGSGGPRGWRAQSDDAGSHAARSRMGNSVRISDARSGTLIVKDDSTDGIGAIGGGGSELAAEGVGAGHAAGGGNTEGPRSAAAVDGNVPPGSSGSSGQGPGSSAGNGGSGASGSEAGRREVAHVSVPEGPSGADGRGSINGGRLPEEATSPPVPSALESSEHGTSTFLPTAPPSAPASLSLNYIVPAIQDALGNAPAPLLQEKQQRLSAALKQHAAMMANRDGPPRMLPATSGPEPQKLSRWCTASREDGPPDYHLVILASPRAQQGRYLATTLVSIAAADAQPASVTVLWAVHQSAVASNRNRRGTESRRLAASTGSSGEKTSRSSSSNSSSTGGIEALKAAIANGLAMADPAASDVSGDSRSGKANASGDGDGRLEVQLVQRLEMPPPARKDPPQAAAGDAFSLLDVLETYADDIAMLSSGAFGGGSSSGGDGIQGGGNAADGRGGTESPTAEAAAVAGATPPLRRPAFPHLRIRYLPEHVKRGDVLANYYEALRVPDQVAEDAGNPRLRELPLLILEGDVVLAPRFGDRVGCLLRMMQDLGREPTAADASAGDGNSTPAATAAGNVISDFAVSLYDPGMVPQEVPKVLQIYRSAPVPVDEVQEFEEDGLSSGGEGRGGSPRRRMQAQRSSGGSTEKAAAGAAEPPTPEGSIGEARSSDGSGDIVDAGGYAGNGAKAAVGYSAGGSGDGVGGDGAADDGDANSTSTSSGGRGGGGVHAFTRLTLVPRVWSWGSQGLLYSYGIRMGLMRHYRELLAGCAPQDGLQDIELVRYMEGRRCFGLPWMPPVKAKPKVHGSACDPRIIHGSDIPTMPPSSFVPCYLFVVRPNLVQHVGASSALFGELSTRFHMSTTFPRRVEIPGLDPQGVW